MEIVKAAGLQKYYTNASYEVRALDGVSLTVEEGEFLAVVGSSGSGKSTLLNMLGGLDEPTAGGVWIRGNSLRDMSREERTIFRRRNIGFVFQQYNLVPVLNVYENIVLPLKLDGAPIDEAFIDHIIDVLDIGEKLYEMPGTLSGGQQQRAAVARALSVKPAIVLADEPTGNLDEDTAGDITEILKESAHQMKKCVIVVTHSGELAKQADVVFRLKKGELQIEQSEKSS